MQSFSALGRIVLVGLTVGVSACAYNGAADLPHAPDFRARLHLASATPLRVDEVLTLVRARNPNLVAARARLAVAHAQLGLDSSLPDPQLTGKLDHPTNGNSTLVDAMGADFSLDTQRLLTSPARRAKAADTFDQAGAEFNWVLRQTDARCLELAASIASGDARLAVLKEAQTNVGELAKRAAKAMRSGDLSVEQAAPLIATAADIDAQLSMAKRLSASKRNDLRALALLDDKSELPLQLASVPPVVTSEQLRNGLANVGEGRSDLAALRHGYKAQDAAVQEAVLAQFPAVSIGFSAARDTGNVRTLGGALTLNLPIFGNAQQNVIVQEATRDLLKAEYEARLHQAAFDSERLFEESSMIHDRLGELDQSLPELRKTGASARQAFVRGDISGMALAAYETTWLTREIERLDLSEALWLNWVATNLTIGRTLQPPAAGNGVD